MPIRRFGISAPPPASGCRDRPKGPLRRGRSQWARSALRRSVRGRSAWGPAGGHRPRKCQSLSHHSAHHAMAPHQRVHQRQQHLGPLHPVGLHGRGGSRQSKRPSVSLARPRLALLKSAPRALAAVRSALSRSNPRRLARPRCTPLRSAGAARHRDRTRNPQVVRKRREHLWDRFRRSWSGGRGAGPSKGGGEGARNQEGSTQGP